MYHLGFTDGRPLTVIANDAGLLRAPVTVERVSLSPAERAEVLVDLQPGQPRILHSFGGDDDIDAGEFDLLKIMPAAQLAPAPPLPRALPAPALPDVPVAATVRRFQLNGHDAINHREMDLARIDEIVPAGTTEIWEVSNTVYAHNFHIHGSSFRILDVNGHHPDAVQAGPKDTVYVPPKGAVRLAVTFDRYADPAHPYMYHCHILRHEDAGMMGQFVTVTPGTENQINRTLATDSGTHHHRPPTLTHTGSTSSSSSVRSPPRPPSNDSHPDNDRERPRRRRPPVGRRPDMLADAEIDAFVTDGYIAVRRAFSSTTAMACRAAVWSALAAARGVLRDNPRTWTAPAVRIACPDGDPFVEAAGSLALAEAYDQLIGAHRWTRRPGIGGDLPIRFPSEEWPGDTSYHIEGNWWGGDEYWIDLRSRGRGLTAFFLLSDVGPDDAPTRLVAGSHLFLPPVLAAAGQSGIGGEAAVSRLVPSVLCRHTAHATGHAGDVYLCHPFLVHTSTWPHRGTTPRMIAQPGVEVPEGFAVDGSDRSPVAQAIVRGLSR